MSDPGIIPPPDARPCWVSGIPDEIYHGDRDTVSSSTLKILSAKSPAHARAELDQPRPETPALLLGRAAHCAALEPDLFTVRYAVAPECDRRTKGGKATWAQFLADHPGASIITASDAETVEGIRAAIEAHPVARHAVRGGQAELSGYFTDPETGVHCRIRPDYLRLADGIMVDLKTTLDASPRAFERSIQQYGYHLQAAMYSAGYQAITGEPLRDFLFLSVEKAPPYAVGLYRLEDQALEVGRRQYRAALRRWAECLERDHWPGYSDRIESISLPAWALIDDEEQSPC
jgi:exodeoxyribonuclease VIII